MIVGWGGEVECFLIVFVDVRCGLVWVVVDVELLGVIECDGCCV